MKILIISNDFSKNGGIEFLSELVYKAIYKHFIVQKFSKRCNNKLIRILKEISIRRSLRGKNLIIFMHSFLYNRYKKYIPNKTKTIIWTHGIEVWGAWGKKKNPNLEYADKVIAVSSFTAERVHENWPSANVSIVNNAIEPFELSNDVEMKNEIVILSRIDSTEKYKGHELVFESLSILKNSDTADIPVFHVIGQGDDRDRLEEVVKTLGISDHVIFHGYVDDAELSHIFSRCFAFVMPSFVRINPNDIWGGEGFGLVYLEAGLHKLPVIACNEGGQTDCVIDGETGFLVNPNPDEIAEKIELLMNNPELAHKMGEAGYWHVKNNFLFDHFEKNVVNVIKEVFA
ncbi:glycosyltransferase family 4 protein [Spiribacter pallidus]|uniref:Glycosyltransferase family 4 protein n=1 Tax=Spiribacter pallidus TaxID=1987936 RepID=A0ABV3TE24_9GAMM